MEALSDPKRSGALLMALGIVMISVVFVFSLMEYTRVRVRINGARDIMDALTRSSGLLIELLFKVAFLGIALAAGSTLVRHAVSLMRDRGEEAGSKEGDGR